MSAFTLTSTHGSTVSAPNASVLETNLSNVPNQIAEDLLRLLRSSVTKSSASRRSARSSEASSHFSGATSPNHGYLSQIEMSILRSTTPVVINETEELTVLGQRGIWVNKNEVQSWVGDLPISEYVIHEDQNPEVINKKITQAIEYVQELAVRYLKPPTPPAPGEIVITMEPNYATGPAPPLVIRQQPARPATPEPMIVREAPPQPPKPIGTKRITISGKRLPPPPRKVVIERLAALPSKPQNVIIERWLPYSEVKRRVVFNKPTLPDPVVVTPRNVIVQWEAPEVNVKKEIKYLGVVRANPVEYVEKYGDSLQSELPNFVNDIETPSEVGVLAADHRARSLIELEGQLEGFQYIDLDKEGLSEYRGYLANLGIRDLGASARVSMASAPASVASRTPTMSSASVSSAASNMSTKTALKIFSMIDTNNNGTITVNEAEKIVLRLNSRLQRSYGENDVKAFFTMLNAEGKDTINKEEFVAAFEKLVLV